MRVIVMATLLALAPACSFAQTNTQTNCGQLKIVNTLSMVRSLDGLQDFVPIRFDAGEKYFLFDTGGSRTQVTYRAAQDMDLAMHDATSVVMDITGRSYGKMVHIDRFVLGHMASDGATFLVSPSGLNADGIFALDYLMNFDADVDFGTDTLNFFSQDHCPGSVVYWQAPAVAVLPMRIDNNHIMVPMTIEGEQVDAMIDSGATDTSLRSDIAENKLHVIRGDADTPKSGALNGVAALPTYEHTFKNLTFGDIVVTNPHVTIIPGDRPTIFGSMGSVKGQPVAPEAIIGMDVLRKLHLYMAFKEKKLYISAASISDKPPPVFPATYLSAIIERMIDKTGRRPPDGPDVLSSRCFWRGIAKTDLDDALADCDQSLKMRAGNWDTLYSKGVVLYQQGKYQDALSALDASNAAGARSVDILFMRGLVKEKLGDNTGSSADMTAAKTASPDVITTFQKLGLVH